VGAVLGPRYAAAIAAIEPDPNQLLMVLDLPDWQIGSAKARRTAARFISWMPWDAVARVEQGKSRPRICDSASNRSLSVHPGSC